jgi:predicted dienelactone hydrolase
VELVTLVDDARSRTLVTHLYVPERGEPAPLVVFAHGLSGHPKRFTRLLSAWADAGYVVAAPVFPHTSDEAPGGVVFDDVIEQPGDVTFVLDALVDDARVDRERVAVAGFSLGALTVYGAAFDRARRDRRFRAAIAMSGRLYPFGGGYELADVPLLAVHDARDQVVPYEDGVAAYEAAAPPKAMLTLHVDGHHEPFEDYGTEAGPIVDAATTAFLDLVLLGREDASARLDAAGDSPLATLVRDGL